MCSRLEAHRTARTNTALVVSHTHTHTHTHTHKNNTRNGAASKSLPSQHLFLEDLTNHTCADINLLHTRAHAHTHGANIYVHIGARKLDKSHTHDNTTLDNN